MKCIFPNCNIQARARNLCQKHFDQIKYKKELSKYPLMRRKSGTGCITMGYKKLTVNGSRIFEHRYIIENSLGRPLKPDEKIHHIDGNSLNNSIDNLIIVSQSDHVIKFHNNRPRIFNWNNFNPINNDNKCQVCNIKTASKFGLCRKHYDIYWHWKKRH